MLPRQACTVRSISASVAARILAQSVSGKKGQWALVAWERYKWFVLVAARILAQRVSVCLEALQVVCSINQVRHRPCSSAGVFLKTELAPYLRIRSEVVSELYCACESFRNEIYIMLKGISSQVARKGYVEFFNFSCSSEHNITHSADLLPTL